MCYLEKVNERKSPTEKVSNKGWIQMTSLPHRKSKEASHASFLICGNMWYDSCGRQWERASTEAEGGRQEAEKGKGIARKSLRIGLPTSTGIRKEEEQEKNMGTVQDLDSHIAATNFLSASASTRNRKLSHHHPNPLWRAASFWQLPSLSLAHPSSPPMGLQCR